MPELEYFLDGVYNGAHAPLQRCHTSYAAMTPSFRQKIKCQEWVPKSKHEEERVEN